MMRRLVAALFVLSAARTHLPGQKQAVHAYKVQGNVWMIVGARANIAMQASKEGIFLVDTGAVGASDAVLAAVREVTDAPIRYIVNTSISVDDVGGNAVLANLAGGATSGKGRGRFPI